MLEGLGFGILNLFLQFKPNIIQPCSKLLYFNLLLERLQPFTFSRGGKQAWCWLLVIFGVFGFFLTVLKFSANFTYVLWERIEGYLTVIVVLVFA